MRGPTGDFLILLVFYDKTYRRFYQKASLFFQVLPELYRNSADFRSIEELLIVYPINWFSIKRKSACLLPNDIDISGHFPERISILISQEKELLDFYQKMK